MSATGHQVPQAQPIVKDDNHLLVHHVPVIRVGRLTGQKLAEPLRVRIGLHTGEAIQEGDDLFGRSVTLAARLGGQADGGQISTSSVVRELASGAEIRFDDAGSVELKGLRGSAHVYRVDWSESDHATPKLHAVGDQPSSHAARARGGDRAQFA